jgi:hypothetical protein
VVQAAGDLIGSDAGEVADVLREQYGTIWAV